MGRSADVIRLGALIASLTLVVGCACKPGMKAFDVRVEPRLASRGEQSAPSSVEVNLIGVNDQDYARWANYPMNQYWSPSDKLRAESSGRAYVMVVSADDPKPKVLPKTDPIWAKWREQGAMHLVVVAFLPGARPTGGRGEPQRLTFPLDNCRWKEVSALNVAVEPTGLTTRSVPAAPE